MLMGKDTAITWCDHTFSPWWGCVKISEACRNCYAATTGHRFGVEWGPQQARRFFGDKHWNEPLRWNAAAKRENRRARVFCASMADVFEDRADLDVHRDRLWKLVAATPHLDWLLLTKRPENFEKMLPWCGGASMPIGDPWTNIWLGVIAEDDARAKERIPTLRGTPAAVRFVSCEPILQHISAETWDVVLGSRDGIGEVHWLIVGDESGPNARAADVEWVRTARDAAARHGVAFHFKQWCGALANGISIAGKKARDRNKKIHLPMLDGTRHASFPMVLR